MIILPPRAENCKPLAHPKIIKQQDIYDLIKERITLQEIGRIYHKIIQPRKWIKLLSCKLERGLFCFGGSSVFDIMHTNSIQVIDRDIFGFCKKGDMLISILKLNLIAIVNPDKDELVWAWGTDELDAQHHPTLLENGNILIYDNGSSRGFTRIIELNPLTGRIVWQYKANPPENFFSKIRGSCQRLPSGNTLITESGKGRVFEVNKENEIVWDFYNPALNEKNRMRGAIYRMTRITDSKNFPNHIKQVFGVDTK